jgi:hypothetical protein
VQQVVGALGAPAELELVDGKTLEHQHPARLEGGDDLGRQAALEVVEVDDEVVLSGGKGVMLEVGHQGLNG